MFAWVVPLLLTAAVIGLDVALPKVTEMIGTLILQRCVQNGLVVEMAKKGQLFNMSFESDVFVHLTVIVCGRKIENIVKVSTSLRIIAKNGKNCEIWPKL